MRRVFHGRAGTGLAFILGVLIATAGSATAAKLITGKQIKNGTITKNDLSKALRAQLAKAGAPGPKGDPGSKGEAGAQGADGVAGLAGTARAYAVVRADGTAVTAKTKNLTVTKPPSVGYYCVTPTAGSGISKSSVQPVATTDFSDGPGYYHLIQSYDATDLAGPYPGCPDGWVFTTDRLNLNGASTSATAANIAFTVVVP